MRSPGEDTAVISAAGVWEGPRDPVLAATSPSLRIGSEGISQQWANPLSDACLQTGRKSRRTTQLLVSACQPVSTRGGLMAGSAREPGRLSTDTGIEVLCRNAQG
jgi:hypothetical protein